MKKFCFFLVFLLVWLSPAALGVAQPGHCSANFPSSFSGSIFDGAYTFADYAAGFFSVHFHINSGAYTPGTTLQITLFPIDDECIEPTVLRFAGAKFSFTSSVEYFSLRFSSATHYDIWNDATNEISTDCIGCSGDTLAALPTYEEVSVSLDAPGINNGLEFVNTTAYSFYPVRALHQFVRLR